ncbi:MAG: HEPN domain-containing protein [Nitrospirae bacterium]|nr:HEPN domain-containing protein [Nitrospirota bacterium]
MADPAIVSEWLCKADEDFNFASANLDEDSGFYAQICFHFHQAAEKYLKAFIVAHDLEFVKLHNLIYLLKICETREPSLNELMNDCEALNTAYIDTRYPVHWPTNYSLSKAMEMRSAAGEVAGKIKFLLEKRQ